MPAKKKDTDKSGPKKAVKKKQDIPAAEETAVQEPELEKINLDAPSETGKEGSKGSKKNVKAAAIAIIILAVIGLVAVAFFNNQGGKANVSVPVTVEYNGFTFTQVEGTWKTNIRLKDSLTGNIREGQILFHLNPYQVEDVPSIENARNESAVLGLFTNIKNIYITTDPEYPAEVALGWLEIAKVFRTVYQIDPKRAFTRPDPRIADPIVTCDNLTATQRVIDLRIGNSTQIYSEHGCVVVQGTNSSEVVRAAEKLSFELMKIMN